MLLMTRTTTKLTPHKDSHKKCEVIARQFGDLPCYKKCGALAKEIRSESHLETRSLAQVESRLCLYLAKFSFLHGRLCPVQYYPKVEYNSIDAYVVIIEDMYLIFPANHNAVYY